MKTQTQDYYDAEYAEKRKPGELFKVWSDTMDTQRYTDGDSDIVYDGATWYRASISRKEIEYNSDLQVSQVEITAARITEPFIDYITSHPIDVVWIEISQIHRDASPIETSIVFVGIVLDVSFQGATAKVICAGLEHFLKMNVPRWRYQATCNHTVFGADCGLDSGEYKTSTSVSVSGEAARTYVSDDFAAKEDGYFTRGYLEYGNYKRLITNHTSNAVEVRYAIPGVASGELYDINAYAGCDGAIETCRDKFDNVNRILAFWLIPNENPVLRT